MATVTAKSRISDEALETSKLLVEFLHASYATRRQAAEAADDAGGRLGAQAPASAAAPASAGEATARPQMSAHAVRAAIHVYQHGERTVGQLASGLGISYGWASRVVDELEAAHYIVREHDPSDRRVVRVRLDDAALEQVERAYAWRGEAVERALEPLSRDRAGGRSPLPAPRHGPVRAGGPSDLRRPSPARAGTIRTSRSHGDPARDRPDAVPPKGIHAHPCGVGEPQRTSFGSRLRKLSRR